MSDAQDHWSSVHGRWLSPCGQTSRGVIATSIHRHDYLYALKCGAAERRMETGDHQCRGSRHLQADWDGPVAHGGGAAKPWPSVTLAGKAMRGKANAVLG